ncbi:uncharacterized protein [Mytilus edulis]|uniref:uncharacterized protein n=1 Tax=Mytilus edulis TaxID=6550 RepID=UPI0039EFC276
MIEELVFVVATVLAISNAQTIRIDIQPDGRLLAFDPFKGTYGTVCSNHWDDVDADVLCSSNGLSNSGQAKSLTRDWTYHREVFGLYCTGNEVNFNDCMMDRYDTTFGGCDNMEDAAIECNNDQKVAIDISSDGRVLYIENGTTESICSYEWDDIDASVLCRNLGLGMWGRAKYLSRDWSYDRRGLYGVFCTGNETDIFDCHFNEKDTTLGMCYQMDDAAVDCYTNSMPMTQFWNDKNGTLAVTSDGRVLYTENGTTETICSYEWDDIDAGVLCRHLGLGMSGGAKYLPRDWSYDRANAYGVFCMGNETDAFDCYVNENDTTHGMCYQMDDAAVDCHPYSMPMNQFWNDKNGTLAVNSDGRVLYTENGTTETICSYEWDDIDAGVLCRHLGLGMSGEAKYLPRDWSYDRANAYGVFCMGNETDAFDCYVNENDTTHGMCYQMDDAAVDCHPYSMPMNQFWNDKNGTLAVNSDGRVLYTENGTTETICSYEWDDIDAGVLCRHLGLGMSGEAKYLPRDWSYDRANAYGVFCMGNETDAFDCYVNENDTTHGMCYQMDDAAVDCHPYSMPMNQFWNDKNGTLAVNSDGRVLYTENGTTETICSYEWDDIDAGVLCRHLGLGMSGGAKYLPRDWSYDRANAYGVFCMGNETDAFDCYVNENDTTHGMCYHMDDAAVDCHPYSMPMNQFWNDKNGTLAVNSDGRVLYTENGTTETICSYEWDDIDAGVLCRHLGLGMSGEAKYLPRDWSYDRANAYGVFCMGNETDAFDCYVNENDTTHGMCYQMDDAAVDCHPYSMPMNQFWNDKNGTLAVNSDGRVLYTENGTTETICSYEWDDIDAGVLCRHLGLGMSGGAKYLPRDWSYDRANAYGVFCMGNETDAFDCYVNENDTTHGMCYHMDDAAVDCHPYSMPMNQFWNDKNGTLAVNSDGRVLYTENGTTETICSYEWDDIDAGVLCRHLGLGMSGGAKYLPRDWSYDRANAYGVFCMGNETDAFDCYVNENDTTHGMCYHMDDAAVDCHPYSMPMNQFWNDKNGTLAVNSDGRVLYTENGTTETICSYEWDDIDAGVLCRHLGLGMSGGAKYLPRDWSYDRANAYGVFCMGNETDAFDCYVNENDTTHGMCYHMDDAAVDCHPYSMPMNQFWNDKNGTLAVNSDGRVLYTENGTTETICSYEWDDIDAGVLCRHLGLGMSGGAKYLPRDWSYDRANAYGVFCMGNETDAFDCYVNENDTTHGMCYHMDDAAVDCHPYSMPMNQFWNDKNGTLAVNSDGRVLYTENGTTETICSYEWDDIDAGVLCRHLGLGMSGGAKYLPRDWSYDRANAYGVFCMGNETDAFDCYVNENDTTHGMCYHMDDAAVDCHPYSMPMNQFWNDKNGTLAVNSDGRVLYTENGTTETICSYEWDDIDAGVLCRHLGLGMSGGAKYLPRDWSYDRANAYGVFCMGNETDAFDCYVNENDTTHGMCYHMDDAAVDCHPYSMPMNQFWNDKNGTLAVNSDGRVLYTENGTTETICSYEWDDIDAGVLCRHLGLGMSGGAKYLPRDWSYDRANAYGVFCMGNETDAFDCYVNENDTTHGMCYHMDDAAVDCHPYSMPMNQFWNDKNGTLAVNSDGRVLYTENGTTETICSYEWDDIDAGVLCRHLGLGMSGGAKYLPRDWSYDRANAYGVFCMGNETDAFDCYVNENDTTHGMCYHMDDAAVDCHPYSMPMNQFWNDKNGTLAVNSDGRVLYTENGTSETICSYEWDDIDAGVLCRHLGLGMSGGAKYLPRDWSYDRANAYGVFCMGNETDAFDCYVNENDTTHGMCYHMDDAAVDCHPYSMPMNQFWNDKNGTLAVNSDGRVLYTENGTTETICSYEWDDIDAGVLCRHLGLGMSGGAKYLPRDWSYDRANAYGVFCMGNETDAFDCYVNENDTTHGMCYHMDDAAVDCHPYSMPMNQFWNDKNGTLAVNSDGRVLYTEHGTTETICSYEWDDIDAGVLCRHLGLGMSGGAKYLPRDWSYDRANAYGVFCMGNETDAFDCYVNENDTTHGMCYHMDDAAVDCHPYSMPMNQFWNDKNGTLAVNSDGRVLYTENGTTETICSYEWDDIDAGVLCRHLGLGMSGGAKYLPRDWSYDRANAYGVFCMGNETDAFDCYVNENDTTHGMCYHMDDAAVDCHPYSMPMNQFWNDKNGTLAVNSDGRVLYTENGTTETICSYEWDDIDAGVLCRHLGLGMSGGAKYLPRDWSYDRANAYGVFCMGNETDAFDCYVNENDTTHGMCYHMDDAAVDCHPYSMPMNQFWNDKKGTLAVNSDGRVLYTENGTTETICSYEWDDIDAGVLCRHLGLGMSGGAKYLPRDWSYDRANAYGVFCMGNETDAFDCYVNENDTTHGMCYHMDDAAVDCHPYSMPMNQFWNDKKGTLAVNSDGRVLYTENGTTETICSYEWDDIDAGVLCRHLGLGMSGGAKYLPRDWSYDRANAYGVFCMGNETDAFDCYVNENDTTHGMCYQMDDAAVDCHPYSMPMNQFWSNLNNNFYTNFIFGFSDDKTGTLAVNSDGRVLYTENGTTETICSYEWDDIDAGVLCRHLGLGMSGGAKYLPRDWSYDRANAYGVFCMGNETDAFDCYVNENDTTNGMCYQMDDAAVECNSHMSSTSVQSTLMYSTSSVYNIQPTSMNSNMVFQSAMSTLQMLSSNYMGMNPSQLSSSNYMQQSNIQPSYSTISVSNNIPNQSTIGLQQITTQIMQSNSMSLASSSYNGLSVMHPIQTTPSVLPQSMSQFVQNTPTTPSVSSINPSHMLQNSQAYASGSSLTQQSVSQIIHSSQTTPTFSSIAGSPLVYYSQAPALTTSVPPHTMSHLIQNTPTSLSLSSINGSPLVQNSQAPVLTTSVPPQSMSHVIQNTPTTPAFSSIIGSSIMGNSQTPALTASIPPHSMSHVIQNTPTTPAFSSIIGSSIMGNSQAPALTASIPPYSVSHVIQNTPTTPAFSSMIGSSMMGNTQAPALTTSVPPQTMSHVIQTTPTSITLSSINGSPLVQNSHAPVLTTSVPPQTMSHVIQTTPTTIAFSNINGSPLVQNSQAPALTTSVPPQSMSHVIQTTPTTIPLSSINGSPLVQNSQAPVLTTSVPPQSMSHVIQNTPATPAFSSILGSSIMGNSQTPALTASIPPHSMSHVIQNTPTTPAFSSIIGSSMLGNTQAPALTTSIPPNTMSHVIQTTPTTITLSSINGSPLVQKSQAPVLTTSVPPQTMSHVIQTTPTTIAFSNINGSPLVQNSQAPVLTTSVPPQTMSQVIQNTPTSIAFSSINRSPLVQNSQAPALTTSVPPHSMSHVIQTLPTSIAFSSINGSPLVQNSQAPALTTSVPSQSMSHVIQNTPTTPAFSSIIGTSIMGNSQAPALTASIPANTMSHVIQSSPTSITLSSINGSPRVQSSHAPALTTSVPPQSMSHVIQNTPTTPALSSIIGSSMMGNTKAPALTTSIPANTMSHVIQTTPTTITLSSINGSPLVQNSQAPVLTTSVPQQTMSQVIQNTPTSIAFSSINRSPLVQNSQAPALTTSVPPHSMSHVIQTSPTSIAFSSIYGSPLVQNSQALALTTSVPPQSMSHVIQNTPTTPAFSSIIGSSMMSNSQAPALTTSIPRHTMSQVIQNTPTTLAFSSIIGSSLMGNSQAPALTTSVLPQTMSQVIQNTQTTLAFSSIIGSSIMSNSQAPALTTSIPPHTMSQVIQNTPITPSFSSINGSPLVQNSQTPALKTSVSPHTMSQVTQNTPTTPAFSTIVGSFVMSNSLSTDLTTVVPPNTTSQIIHNTPITPASSSVNVPTLIQTTQSSIVSASIPLQTTQPIQNTPTTPASSSVNGAPSTQPTTSSTTSHSTTITSSSTSSSVNTASSQQTTQTTQPTTSSTTSHSTTITSSSTSSSVNTASSQQTTQTTQPTTSSTTSHSTTITSSSTSSSVNTASSQQTTQTSSNMSSNSSTTTQSSLSNNLGSGSSSVWSFFSTKMMILTVLMMIAIQKMFCRDA